MLLACCFRQSTTKKHKKNKKWGKEKFIDIEETYTLTESLIATPIIKSNNIKQDLNKKTIKQQEKTKEAFRFEHNVNGEDIHIEKEETTQYQSAPENIIQSTYFDKEDKNQTNSQSFTNTSVKQNKQQLNPKGISHMFVSDEDLDTIRNSKRELITYTHPAIVYTTTSTNTNDSKTEKDNDDTLGGGREYGIKTKDEEQNNLEMTSVKEKENNTSENGKILKTFKEEYEGKIEGLKIQHRTELQTVKQKYLEEFNREKENNRKEIEMTKILAKNEANENISEVNRQIVLERGKMLLEQQEQNRRLEEEYRMKEERINQSMEDNEKRKRAWEDEKANILIEIQRLKAEATKMVKIVAMEYEKDNLNEEKKRSLSQEVYSLQLVVEMRSEALKNLKEQLARAKIELDHASAVKEKLKKATARIEDLEEQLRIKHKLEKQLSLEKAQLEQNLTETSKSMDRMSKDVETLQWRIRNNYDVPDVSVGNNYQNQDKQTSSLSSYYDDKHQLFTECISTRPQSTPEIDKKLELKQRKTNLFLVSEEMMDAITTVTKYEGKLGLAGNVDELADSTSRAKTKDCESETEDHLSDCDAEIDSLDEGVGDVSSEGEHGVHSPVTDYQVENNKKENEKALTIPLQGECNQLQIPLYSAVTDRIPSRFGFQ